MSFHVIVILAMATYRLMSYQRRFLISLTTAIYARGPSLASHPTFNRIWNFETIQIFLLRHSNIFPFGPRTQEAVLVSLPESQIGKYWIAAWKKFTGAIPSNC